MQSLLTELIDSVVAMPEEFATVAGNDPLAAAMMAVGTVVMIVSFGAFGYLTLGALVDLVTPDVSGRSPPTADR